jgi:DNA-directed RNA polymerase subunit RPC12/RpoP
MVEIETMTSPIEEIIVKCPKCGKEYQSYYRPSMNLPLDNFDEEYISKMSSATCPNCGYRVELCALVVDKNGTFNLRR